MFTKNGWWMLVYAHTHKWDTLHRGNIHHSTRRPFLTGAGTGVVGEENILQHTTQWPKSVPCYHGECVSHIQRAHREDAETKANIDDDVNKAQLILTFCFQQFFNMSLCLAHKRSVGPESSNTFYSLFLCCVPIFCVYVINNLASIGNHFWTVS